MNAKLVSFWSLHKKIRSCGSNCSKGFVSDGFPKTSRFICSNTKKTIYNEELGKRNSLSQNLVSSFYFHGGRIQVGCGNRPDYEGKQKANEDEADESVVLSENIKDLNLTMTLCRVCKSNTVPENIEEEIVVNTECNIDRNPRFVNWKAKSYAVIYTMYNCGNIVDFLEINLSEQVYVTLLHWTNMLHKIQDLSSVPKVFIYDNACSVWIYFKKRLHENKTINPTEVALFLDSCDLYIDRLQQKTHT